MVNRHGPQIRDDSDARYEKWTRDSLYPKARQVGIAGRSQLNKQGPIKALRHH